MHGAGPRRTGTPGTGPGSARQFMTARPSWTPRISAISGWARRQDQLSVEQLAVKFPEVAGWLARSRAGSRPRRVEDCSFRHIIQHDVGNGVACCTLLQKLSGVEQTRLCEVPRDICEACCGTSEPLMRASIRWWPPSFTDSRIESSTAAASRAAMRKSPRTSAIGRRIGWKSASRTKDRRLCQGDPAANVIISAESRGLASGRRHRVMIELPSTNAVIPITSRRPWMSA